MSQRYIGSSISPTAAPTSSVSTTGVWSINDQYQAKNAGNWPMYVPPATTDPYFSYVSMLLPGNGTNGAQNNTFVDSSTNNFTITRNGNTTQGTASPYYSCWSNYFDGSGDSLSISNNGGVIPSTSGTFTIEAWVYSTALQAEFATPRAPCMFGDMNGATNYMSFGPVNYAGVQYVGLYWVGGSSAGCYGTTTPLALNTWYHIAISVSANSIKLFVNGILQTLSGTSTLTNRGGTAGAYAIGNYNSNTCAFTGHISNLRVVNGTALYSTSFTPSTTPLTAVTNTTLLTCQSNRFMDNSANNFTVTKNGDTSVQKFSPFSPSAPYAAATNGGSAYFDGSGDYLANTVSSVMNFGTGDFTVEYWQYYTVALNSNFQVAIGSPDSGSNIAFGTNVSGVVYATTSTTGYTASASIVPNSWQHIAWVRSSGTLKAYLNGVQVFSGSVATSFDNVGFGIGASKSGSYQIAGGYLSNIRVVKGTAVYTSAFVPPAAPVTAITNTSLLVNATNGGIIDNASINDFETVGTAQIGTGQSKFGGSSAYFPAKTDVLSTLSNKSFATLGGDFTIECWVYPTDATLTTIWGVLDARAAAASATSWFLGLSNYSSGWLMSFYNGGFNYGTTRIQASTWTHCAWVRVGSTLTFYVNGVAGGTATISGAITGGTTTVWVGNKDNANAGYGTLGYIDDLRITNGYARYTTNFTPPTAAFPTA